MNIYERNYKRMLPLIEGMIDTEKNYRKMSAGEALNPLTIEKLYDLEDGRTVYSMTHYFKQNGDMMKDPDMEIAVDVKNQMVEALTFENSGMGIYQEVYLYENGKKMYRPRLKKELNNFLFQWLKNIKEQGYEEVELR